ncbi:MAG: hypothetical protein IPK65_06820 [Gammaproteobacteria bacterium]|nr:hypothetical protein [Gammaproteobacteria bacterium]
MLRKAVVNLTEVMAMSEIHSDSRRRFLKKSAYVVPVVITMHAAPSLAGHGSPRSDKDKDKKDKDYEKVGYKSKDKDMGYDNNKNKRNNNSNSRSRGRSRGND